MFEILKHNKLFLKKSKCSFGQGSVEYLGHILSKEGVALNPAKIQDKREWHVPRNVKEMNGFLGLTSYYRKFVPGYGKICHPLYQLTRNYGFQWSAKSIQAFEKLTVVMISPHVLALPDFSKPLKLECDALGCGIGAVLQQCIAFSSQSLRPRN